MCSAFAALTRSSLYLELIWHFNRAMEMTWACLKSFTLPAYWTPWNSSKSVIHPYLICWKQADLFECYNFHITPTQPGVMFTSVVLSYIYTFLSSMFICCIQYLLFFLSLRIYCFRPFVFAVFVHYHFILLLFLLQNCNFLYQI